jgi:hypothetical protein
MPNIFKTAKAVMLLTLSGFAGHCNGQTTPNSDMEFTFNGNRFSSKFIGFIDTMYLLDPVTEKESVRIVYEPQVATMNGKKIYEVGDAIRPPLRDNVSPTLERYLLDNLTKGPMPKGIPNGYARIHLHDFVVDETGKVVYYCHGSNKFVAKDNIPRSLNDFVPTDSLISSFPAMKPYTLNGEKVIVRLSSSLYTYVIEVKNGVAHYYKCANTARWCRP